jgi:hypothetical protein
MIRDRVSPLFVGAALLVGAGNLTLAQDALDDPLTQTRHASRVWIFHCITDAPPEPQVIFLPEGVEPPTFEGELPAGVGCILLDSYDQDVIAEGRLMTIINERMWLEEAIYEFVLHTTGRTYRLSDWVETVSHRNNGATYKVRSRLREDQFGDSIEYDIRFMRRTPDLCLEPSTGELMDCPDRTTMFIVELPDPGITAILDFRP